jgi:hypothetical protein
MYKYVQVDRTGRYLPVTLSTYLVWSLDHVFDIGDESPAGQLEFWDLWQVGGRGSSWYLGGPHLLLQDYPCFVHKKVFIRSLIEKEHGEIA